MLKKLQSNVQGPVKQSYLVCNRWCIRGCTKYVEVQSEQFSIEYSNFLP